MNHGSDSESQTLVPRIISMTVDRISRFRDALDAVAREREFLTLLEAPPLEHMIKFITSSLERKDPRFIAIVGDAVVGWCDIARHPFEAHAHRGSLGIGVTRAYRGQGLGKQLITAALEQAWIVGLRRVELRVHVDNIKAISLYSKVGFTQEGIERCAVHIDGVYRDALCMAVLHRSINSGVVGLPHD